MRSVHVSIAHQEALVEYDPARLTPEVVTAALQAVGFTVHPPDEADRFAEEKRELAQARRLAWVAAGLLATASALMLASSWWGPTRVRVLVMGLLAGFAALEPARWVLRNAWEFLRRGILNQDVLAAAAALAGLAGGVAGLCAAGFPAGEFFGAAVYVLAFHLVGGYLSVLVHVRASQSVRKLLSLNPGRAPGPPARADQVATPSHSPAVLPRGPGRIGTSAVEELSDRSCGGSLRVRCCWRPWGTNPRW